MLRARLLSEKKVRVTETHRRRIKFQGEDNNLQRYLFMDLI